jgi:hypothetical protein
VKVTESIDVEDISERRCESHVLGEGRDHVPLIYNQNHVSNDPVDGQTMDHRIR